MTTRSELRAQRQQEEQAAQTEAPVVEPTPPRHHLLFRLWGIICLTILLLVLVLNSTLLSANFMKKEITSSSLESVMLSEVNSSLTQYGISTSVLKKSETDKLITQAVDQVYAGEKINLDLSSVVSSVNSSVDSQLSQYGLSTSMLPAGSTSAVTGNINAAVNSQLNTPAVTQLITGIKVAKTVNNLLLIVSLAGLLIMLVLALWRHHLLASFSWICLLAAILFAGIMAALHGLAIQIGQQQADLSPFIAQIADAVQQRGFSEALMIGGLAICLFIFRIGMRIWQSRHWTWINDQYLLKFICLYHINKEKRSQ